MRENEKYIILLIPTVTKSSLLNLESFIIIIAEYNF